MPTAPSHRIVSLSLRGSSDIGIQNACHHLLEHKSVTGDSLMLYKHVYYTQYMHTLYMNLSTVIAGAEMLTLSAIICDVEMKNTDFRHQYFNRSANCLQDICCIIKSELLAVGSMSWVILIDRRNSYSTQRDERCL